MPGTASGHGLRSGQRVHHGSAHRGGQLPRRHHRHGRHQHDHAEQRPLEGERRRRRRQRGSDLQCELPAERDGGSRLLNHPHRHERSGPLHLRCRRPSPWDHPQRADGCLVRNTPDPGDLLLRSLRLRRGGEQQSRQSGPASRGASGLRIPVHDPVPQQRRGGDSLLGPMEHLWRNRPRWLRGVRSAAGTERRPRRGRRLRIANGGGDFQRHHLRN